MTSALAALAGVCVITGILVLLTPPHEGTTGPSRVWVLRAQLGGGAQRTAWQRSRLLIALGAGLVAWAWTAWPVGALIAAAAVLGLPALLGSAKAANRAIDRLEALEEWARRVADILATGTGLEQALVSSLRTCPADVEPEIGALVARLRAHWPLEDALRALAEDIDDTAGDLLSAALILSARRRGAGLARVLTSVADSIAEEVASRRRIEAERAKPRTTARAVTLITLGMIVVGSANRTYLAPYSQPLGQVVLLILAAAFVGCLIWMRAMTQAPRPTRVLNTAPQRSGSAGTSWGSGSTPMPVSPWQEVNRHG